MKDTFIKILPQFLSPVAFIVIVFIGLIFIPFDSTVTNQFTSNTATSFLSSWWKFIVVSLIIQIAFAIQFVKINKSNLKSSGVAGIAFLQAVLIVIAVSAVDRVTTKLSLPTYFQLVWINAMPLLFGYIGNWIVFRKLASTQAWLISIVISLLVPALLLLATVLVPIVGATLYSRPNPIVRQPVISPSTGCTVDPVTLKLTCTGR